MAILSFIKVGYLTFFMMDFFYDNARDRATGLYPLRRDCNKNISKDP